MEEDTLSFPALCFAPRVAWVARDLAELTSTTRKGLKSGRFSSLVVVEATGRAHRFNGAVEAGPAEKPSWVPGLALSRWFRVELNRDGAPFQMTVEELKERTLRSLMDSWIEADLVEELEPLVRQATTTEAIVQAVSG